MTSRTKTRTTSKTHFIPNFEMHSVLLIAALALTAAPASRAQDNNPAARPAPSSTSSAVPPNRTTAQDVEAAFTRADTNRDGKLTRQEAERFPAVAQRFEQIDANQDTFISREEFTRAAGS